MIRLAGSSLLFWFVVQLAWGQTPPIGDIVDQHRVPSFALCGGAGQACCHAPSSIPQTDGPLVTCKVGLGCDLASNTCVSPCGGPGQACCDGPDARAPRWTNDGRVFVPTGVVHEMCQDSVCDPATHRCNANCGKNAGDACCGIQPGVGVASCLNPKLYCALDANTYASGTCQPCGLLDKPACAGPKACEDGLAPDERTGLCVHCGHPGLIVCDRGPPCDVQSVPDPITHTQCVAAGGPNQPCLAAGTCGYQGLLCNAHHVCESCGNDGQRCCPGDNACVGGVCGADGRCVTCGQEGARTCPIGEPCPRGGEPDGGTCKACGGEGQICCFSDSIRCETGLRCDDRTCKANSPSPPVPPNDPRTCSNQPYTWSASNRNVPVEDAKGCAKLVPYTANSDAEALQCARAQFGDKVITSSVDYYPVSLTCPYSGCIQRQVLAKDQGSAKRCAASVEGPGSCTVVPHCD